MTSVAARHLTREVTPRHRRIGRRCLDGIAKLRGLRRGPLDGIVHAYMTAALVIVRERWNEGRSLQGQTDLDSSHSSTAAAFASASDNRKRDGCILLENGLYLLDFAPRSSGLEEVM